MYIRGTELALPQLLKQSGLTASTSEALRMIEQGGVKLDGNKVVSKTQTVAVSTTIIAQVGKENLQK